MITDNNLQRIQESLSKQIEQLKAAAEDADKSLFRDPLSRIANLEQFALEIPEQAAFNRRVETLQGLEKVDHESVVEFRSQWLQRWDRQQEQSERQHREFLGVLREGFQTLGQALKK